MKNKIYVIILIAIAFIGLSKLKTYWDFRQSVVISPVLTQAEKSKEVIDLDARTITIIERDGDRQVRRTRRGVRHIATTLNKDGTIDRIIINRGFAFEPGLLLGTDSQGALVGVDTQWFYWSDFGLISGLSALTTFKNPRLHLAVSYNLSSIKLNNTSLFVGVNTNKSLMFGTRLSF